ncbi:PAS domain-containing sensor histidine kinase [Methanolobus sp. ZRKC2]|uniref:PAS domain-containing sensor histidine kinase n=1 Tax=Methanolobus sp. ZRKC2 TaxID=3125783 RepID=UPI0032471719
MNDHYQEIIKDVSLLYELSLSIGTSLDLKTNCDTFLSKLLARENFVFASVWIKDKYLTQQHSQKATLVYANPEYLVRDANLSLSNPVFTLTKEKEPIVVGSSDDYFQEMVAEKNINDGTYYIFPLGDIGFLKLYSSLEKKTHDETILNKLINVISKFTVSIEACLYHERSVMEVEERRRAESKLRISEKRFKDMAELLPEMIYECDLKGDFTYINKSGLRMLGISRKELYNGFSLSELIPESEKAKFKNRFADLLSAKELPSIEYDLLTKEGQTVSVIMSSTVMIRGGEVVGLRGIIVDITEKRKMQDFLLDAKMIAVANRVKNDFFANMSHELRTPLNSIIGFSAVLEDEVFGELNGDQSRYVQYINSSGKRLLELIDDLLSISKMETQNIEINTEHFDIMRAVVEVTEALKPVMLRDNVHLTVATQTEVGKIHADRSKFKQIIYSLLSCILKHTGEKQKVSLELSMVINMLKITVKGDTKTFSAYEREKIIDILTENFKSIPKNNEVFELELMITKRFIELHGGSIWFEANEKDNCFSFILPVAIEKEKESQLVLV